MILAIVTRRAADVGCSGEAGEHSGEHRPIPAEPRRSLSSPGVPGLRLAVRDPLVHELQGERARESYGISTILAPFMGVASTFLLWRPPERRTLWRASSTAKALPPFRGNSLSAEDEGTRQKPMKLIAEEEVEPPPAKIR